MNAVVDMLVTASTTPIAPPHDADDRARYERCIRASKRVSWDIETDVFRGRTFDFKRKFLPDSLTKINELSFLAPEEQLTMSHVQGRTYANIFALVERFIGAKALQLACANGLGDQVVLEGLVRFSEEEIKHQELFRRIEAAIGARMPSGYVLFADSNEIARKVLSRSSWAVLAFTCHIELFTQAHYRESIEHEQSLSDLYRDVLRFHWLEECQHVAIDEIEWRREHEALRMTERDRAVDDLSAMLRMFDEILQGQAAGDAGYFMRLCDRNFSAQEQRAIRDTMLRAYRWQYIASGMRHPHFREILLSLTTPRQRERIDAALVSILGTPLDALKEQNAQ